MKNQRHFILHKPMGVISQFVQNQKRKKKLLGDLFNFPEKTMAIGRLDANSEGLLLLTTDGKLCDDICSSKVEKEYHVQLDGMITSKALKQLQQGVEIGLFGKRYTTKKCAVNLLENPNYPPPAFNIREHRPCSWISIKLREGKFRQVRKMTAAVGFPTLRLIRVRIGSIHLAELKSGEVQEMENLDQAFTN